MSTERTTFSDTSSKIKIGFFGDGKWARNALCIMQNEPDIETVFVAIRSKTPDINLQNLAESFQIRTVRPDNVNTEDFLDWVAEFNCDLFASLSFDQIFRSACIDLPSKGIINCHAGKLPMYRGRNVLNWVFINDEKEFGITVHYVDEGIDTGDIILQETYPITDSDNYATLLELAHKKCAILLVKAIKMISCDEVRRVPQHSIHPVGMYCTGRVKGDEILDWSMTSREVFNFVRAIYEPGPIARSWLGDQEVFINWVEMVPNAPIYKCIPGSVLCNFRKRVLVKTGDSLINIIDYRKKGRSLRVGDRLQPSPGQRIVLV